MRVLYIDPFCVKGHINFNRIHIQALQQQGGKIDYIFKDGYAERIGLPGPHLILSLSNHSCKGRLKGLINRIRGVLDLQKVKRRINLNEYDYIIISHYDEIMLWLADFPASLLINHTNVAGIENYGIKRWIYKKISHRHLQLVMDSLSISYLKSIGISHVQLLRHGMLPPFQINFNQQIDTISIPYSDTSVLIFSPSAGSINKTELKLLVEDVDFLKFLTENDIYLLLKTDGISKSPHIIYTNRRLTELEYQYFFLKSDIIFLPYPITYKYRTSGILFEAISNNKRILISDIPAFREYEEILGIESFYSSLQVIEHKLLSIKRKIALPLKYNCNSQLLLPDYSFILFN